MYSNCSTGAVAKRFSFKTSSNTSSCVAPTYATAFSVTTNSATIYWTKTDASNYYIYVLPEGGSWYLAASNLTSNLYKLNGLAANKTYTIDVYSNCYTSAVAKRFSFKTSSNTWLSNAPNVAQSSNAVNVGQNDLDNSSSIIVYPNPSSSGIFNINKAEEWKVYNLAGIKVLEGSGVKVDISLLSKGVYMLRTTSGSKALIYQ